MKPRFNSDLVTGARNPAKHSQTNITSNVKERLLPCTCLWGNAN